ncbi:hypothetical protein B0H11DRAFT_2187886 [Mycena galericulata]|nr:hypothetical protein B0H11DRAFT_2187886 [Mycena galericulata]
MSTVDAVSCPSRAQSPTNEVVFFDPAAAYKADPIVATEAFKLVLRADGAIPPAYYGLKTEPENPARGLIVINWVNEEAHKEFSNDPSFPEVVEIMSTKVLGGNTTTYYIIFNQDPALALSEPEMGFLHLKKKPEGDTKVIVALLTLLSDESGGYLVFGAALADPDAYVVLGKWPSPQAQASTEEERNMRAEATLKALEEHIERLEFFHTSLSTYRLP